MDISANFGHRSDPYRRFAALHMIDQFYKIGITYWQVGLVDAMNGKYAPQAGCKRLFDQTDHEDAWLAFHRPGGEMVQIAIKRVGGELSAQLSFSPGSDEIPRHNRNVGLPVFTFTNS